MSYFTGDTQPELNFAIRTKTFINRDVVTSTGSVASDLGIRKALLVTGPVMEKSEGFAKTAESLGSAGIEYLGWSQVEPETPEGTIGACVEAYREGGCDGIIALGGGSSMDTAKLAGCIIAGGGYIQEYDSMVQERQVPQNPPPLICIPTTAGTGSEVTSMAVFSRADDSSKRVVTGPSLCPKVALVDPPLSYSMPPELTAITGMDAFNHSIEAYLSTLSNPISDSLSLYALELIAEFLPRAVKNGRDEEARANMSVAATMAGMAISHAMPHFAHAIGHVLGAKLKLPHGLACSLALPRGLRMTKGPQLNKFRKIAFALGLAPRDHADDEETAEAVIKSIEGMMREIGLPELEEVVRKDNGNLAYLAAASASEPGMMFSPVLLTDEDVAHILGADND
jgi:alcohol dehydrogenase